MQPPAPTARGGDIKGTLYLPTQEERVEEVGCVWEWGGGGRSGEGGFYMLYSRPTSQSGAAEIKAMCRPTHLYAV